jgi:hypothetical protein
VEHLSGQKVVFDDVLLEITSPETAVIVQEAHYDPWGLELAGIGYNAPGNAEHSWKFNGGVERTVNFGLSWDWPSATRAAPACTTRSSGGSWPWTPGRPGGPGKLDALPLRVQQPGKVQ